MIADLYNGRKSARAATNHLASVQWRRGVVSARVIDMSMTGAKLATHAEILTNEEIVLTTVRMGSRPAIVVRVADGELGIRFTDEIAREFELRAAR